MKGLGFLLHEQRFLDDFLVCQLNGDWNAKCERGFFLGLCQGYCDLAGVCGCCYFNIANRELGCTGSGQPLIEKRCEILAADLFPGRLQVTEPGSGKFMLLIKLPQSPEKQRIA